MTAALPCLFAWAAYRFWRARGSEPLDAFVRAAIAFGVAVVLIAEALSLFRALSFWADAVAWAAALALALALTVGLARARSARRPSLEPRGVAAPESRPSVSFRSDPFAAGFLALALAGTFAAALLSVPNNWDSMVYHLARIPHWITNRRVWHYATSIDRQLWSNPWAELVQAHAHALGARDRLDNFVQWLAFAGSLLLVVGIARRLSGSRRGALAAALVAAGTPEIVLQASSTQNDLVTGFWIACFAYSLLIPPERFFSESIPLWAGLSLGLAVCTKSTAPLFAAPLLVWGIARIVRSSAAPPVRVLRAAAVILLVAAAVAAPHFARNVALFGNPLGERSIVARVEYRDWSIPSLASNVSKNVAQELTTPWTAVNSGVDRALAAFHRQVLRREIFADPESAMWFGFRADFTRHEDWAGNPLLVLAVLASAVVLAVRWRRTEPALRGYFLCVAAGFLLYCAAIAWQPWGTRLHVPALLLAAPAVALLLFPARGWVRAAVALPFLAAGLPPLLANQSRPLLPGGKVPSVVGAPSEAQYFANRPELYRPYRELADRLAERGCRLVALKTTSFSWEYPLWELSRRRGNPAVFRAVEVDNPSARLEDPDAAAAACALVAIDQPEGWRPDAARFKPVWRRDPVALFERR